jgi:hypothetical protein
MFDFFTSRWLPGSVSTVPVVASDGFPPNLGCHLGSGPHGSDGSINHLGTLAPIAQDNHICLSGSRKRRLVGT